MSPGFPRAELVPAPQNDCPECSDSMLHGHVFVMDLHHLGEYRPCPRCNPTPKPRKRRVSRSLLRGMRKGSAR